MNIRLSQKMDIPKIMEVYAIGKETMDKVGNPNQWIDGYPKLEMVENDIKEQISYVIEHENEIVGVFAFIIGTDPTYLEIFDGAWLNDEEYGTVHRLASNGKVKGLFNACFDYCKTKIKNVRCDTHHDNHIMQKLFIKYGFKECGIIYVDDGSARIAYHLINELF